MSDMPIKHLCFVFACGYFWDFNEHSKYCKFHRKENLQMAENEELEKEVEEESDEGESTLDPAVA